MTVNQHKIYYNAAGNPLKIFILNFTSNNLFFKLLDIFL